MHQTQLTIEQPTNAGEQMRRREHRERARKNWEWLEAHQDEVYPKAFGRFLAVAGQEAFIADTLEAALSWVRSRHPEDSGHIVEYVMPPGSPRVYSGRPC